MISHIHVCNGTAGFYHNQTSLILTFKAAEVQGRKLSTLEAMLKGPPWSMAVKTKADVTGIVGFM